MATVAFSIDDFPPSQTLAWARAIENGLPISAVKAMLSDGAVKLIDLVDIVAKRRTLDRRLAEDDLLTSEESDRFARFVEVLGLATHIFGDRESAMEWLRAPKRRFDGARPLEMMRTYAGSNLVVNLLNLSRHGMLA